MSWLITTLGLGVILLVLRDVFDTLFHPTGDGRIADGVMRVVWRVTGLAGPRSRTASLSGPLGMAAAVVTWGALTTLGWTLIYVVRMPHGFSFGPTLDPAHRSDVLDALYLSLVAVATLGFGDIVPTSPVLRLAAPLEALVGFFLLTAAVSWVLQTYPALNRRRVLALRLSLLHGACRDGSPPLGDVIPVGVLFDLVGAVAQVRVDLNQYGVTYYFRDRDDAAPLSGALSFAVGLARDAAASPDPAVRFAGAALGKALDDLAETLRRRFPLVGGSTDAVLRAYDER